MTTSAPLAVHLRGQASPLVRAAVAAGVQVRLAATYPATYRGTRYLERRLKRWHKTGQLCAICRAQRGGRAR